MPTKSFNQGTGGLPATINATEYPSLLWQLLPCLGMNATGTVAVFNRDEANRLGELIRSVLDVYDMLWKPVHVERELSELDMKIRRQVYVHALHVMRGYA